MRAICFIVTPPYESKQSYGYNFERGFDHAAFWNWVRECSKRCFVFVSEENFPDDFEVIWEKEVVRTLQLDNKKKSAEKLGIWKDGLVARI